MRFPAPSGADVWFAREESLHGQRAAYLAILSGDERARHARLMFEADRDRFAAARGMLRTLLEAYTGVPAAECAIAHDANGRPHVAAGTGLDFNLSHTRGMIAVAFAGAPAGPVGVDVETLARDWQPELPRRYFAPAEIAALEALPRDAQHARFYEIWTLKEAYVKARGAGLALPLDAFAVHVGDDGRASVTFDAGLEDSAARWQLAVAAPDPGFRLAVALAREGADRPIVTRAFEPGAWMPWRQR